MKAIHSNRYIFSRALYLVTGKSIGAGAEIKDVPLPTLSPTELLIKVSAVALNPIDHKYIDLLSPKGSRIGCDYVGTISEIGSSAKGNWKVGDRVAGLVHGGLYLDEGSFAEYLKVDADLVWRVPEEMGDEEAATYGISAVTAMFALNVHLELPWVDAGPISTSESERKETILIYSGATAFGLFAIQLAKAAGYEVVTTASPRSTSLVTRYGADAVFDYHSPTAIEEIRTQYPHIKKAFDCISLGSSSDFCAQVLKANGGKVITLLDTGKSKVPGVVIENIVVFTVFGRAWQWIPPIGPRFEVHASHRDAFARFYAALPSMTKFLRAPPVEVVEGGFEGIFKGLDDYRAGKVAGKKLVVKIEQ